MYYLYSLLALLTLSFSNAQSPEITNLRALIPRKSEFYQIRERQPDYPEIEFSYIYENCNHQGNSIPVEMDDIKLINKYGRRIIWNFDRTATISADTVTGNAARYFDDIDGIFDCTIRVKLGPHDKTINYQEFIFGFIYWIQFDRNKEYIRLKGEEVKKLEPKNTIANRGLLELQRACGKAKIESTNTLCSLVGCVVIAYGNVSKAYCDVSQNSINMGDEKEWFTRDDVTIRVLLIGSFIGKDYLNKNVNITFPPFLTTITLDFTRLYGGPCENSQQFYCPTHGVCIRLPLACDSVPMTNCPVYETTKNDEQSSTQCQVNNIPPLLNKLDPDAMQNLIIFWVLLGLFLAFLAFLILNYLFWRPGYLIWRCGRIRNWFSFGNSCYKSCHSCSKGDCAQCCKTSGKFDTTEPSTIAWTQFSMGDGFHMRENR